MKADLLIINYNTKDLLKRLLDTLHSDYEPDVWNLYIQDNGSTDGSVEFLRNTNTQYDIKHISYSKNVGYSRAINSLGTITDSEVLVAVNADTWFTTNHVKQALKTFEDNPNQAVLGVKQLDEKKHIRHGGIFWDGLGSKPPFHRGWNLWDPYDNHHKDRIQCWTVSGSIYYMRRTVWDEVGSYLRDKGVIESNETGSWLSTPHYYEETFFSQVVQHLGYEVWYDGAVETAGHSWHASSPVGGEADQKFHQSQKMYVEACEKLGIAHEIRK